MDATEMNDPFAYIVDLCLISPSQEEILRRCPFVGQTINLPGEGAPSTLPETSQDARKDRSYRDILLTSPGQQSSTSYFGRRAVDKAVQTDDETHGFEGFKEYAEAAAYVDLSDDSELGFPLAKLNQMTDRTLVAECSSCTEAATVIEISNCEIDKYQISRRELSPKDSFGESPHKKMKISDQNPGFKSSQACLGMLPQKIGENLQNCERKLVSDPKSPCNFGADPRPQQNIQIGKEMPLGVNNEKNHSPRIPENKNLGSCENLGSPVTRSKIARSTGECFENVERRVGNCEAEKLACAGKVNKTVNEIAETSGKKGGDEPPKLRVLPPSIVGCLKDITKGKKENGKGYSFVFDVLKNLKSLKKEDFEKDSLDNVSWLELAKSKGITFPTPWWREK